MSGGSGAIDCAALSSAIVSCTRPCFIIVLGSVVAADARLGGGLNLLCGGLVTLTSAVSLVPRGSTGEMLIANDCHLISGIRTTSYTYGRSGFENP